MIKSFRHKGLEEIFHKGTSKKLPADMIARIENILTLLDVAISLDEMARPAFRLHPLKGDLKGFWAVTVRANWRTIFRFEEEVVSDVDFVDYH